jgi:hypothetical protein
VLCHVNYDIFCFTVFHSLIHFGFVVLRLVILPRLSVCWLMLANEVRVRAIRQSFRVTLAKARKQTQQLRDIHRSPACFIFAERLCCRSSFRLIPKQTYASTPIRWGLCTIQRACRPCAASATGRSSDTRICSSMGVGRDH